MPAIIITIGGISLMIALKMNECAWISKRKGSFLKSILNEWRNTQKILLISYLITVKKYKLVIAIGLYKELASAIPIISVDILCQIYS